LVLTIALFITILSLIMPITRLKRKQPIALIYDR
jgi:hypothetical protein